VYCVYQDVALDHGRRDAVREAHPEVRAKHLVLRREAAQVLEQLVLAARLRQVERSAQADGRGDRLVDQLVQRGCAHGGEHLGDVALTRADVAVNKGVGVLEVDAHDVSLGVRARAAHAHARAKGVGGSVPSVARSLRLVTLLCQGGAGTVEVSRGGARGAESGARG
jgi:hypothetical protein